MLSFGAQKPFLLVLFFMVLMVAKSLRIPHHYHRISVSLRQEASALKGDEDRLHLTGKGKEELGMELYPTGSSLPDCSHACGPCFPCKRVMVSLKCFTESCPIVYRCMCKGKYYHVPSN